MKLQEALGEWGPALSLKSLYDLYKKYKSERTAENKVKTEIRDLYQRVSAGNGATVHDNLNLYSAMMTAFSLYKEGMDEGDDAIINIATREYEKLLQKIRR